MSRTVVLTALGHERRVDTVLGAEPNWKELRASLLPQEGLEAAATWFSEDRKLPTLSPCGPQA